MSACISSSGVSSMNSHRPIPALLTITSGIVPAALIAPVVATRASGSERSTAKISACPPRLSIEAATSRSLSSVRAIRSTRAPRADHRPSGRCPESLGRARDQHRLAGQFHAVARAYPRVSPAQTGDVRDDCSEADDERLDVIPADSPHNPLSMSREGLDLGAAGHYRHTPMTTSSGCFRYLDPNAELYSAIIGGAEGKTYTGHVRIRDWFAATQLVFEDLTSS